MKMAIGRFAVRHAVSILFVIAALCAGGVYAAMRMPSSVFPLVNFPRVIIMVDNGVMPADEMMATITRPIEEAVKEVPGCRTIRSATGRGTAEIDVFFDWDADMVQSEIHVQSRLSQLRASLPATANEQVYRMTFAVFPIIGLSVTSPKRDVTSLWELARYDLKPKLLRIPGVGSVDVVGGRAPEYRVVVDVGRASAVHLGLTQVAAALEHNNVVVPSGLHEEDHDLLLTAVDGRLHSADDIRALTLPTDGGPVRLGAIATVERGPEVAFNRVTADGVDAVLLNIFAQPDGSILDIDNHLQEQLRLIRRDLPPDVKIAYFYNQSLMVRDSVQSAWEAIAFGLILSAVILYVFLRDWGSTIVAITVIPTAVLFTILAMKLCGLTFNLMTLGGIAAAIGLVIDDAIVVVEAIHTKMATGLGRIEAVQAAIADIFSPLLGSTLTPVVVFIPLAFLHGIAGVFFRSLALTMAVSLITSLILALTLTPSLASWIVRPPRAEAAGELEQAERGGIILRTVILSYEWTVRLALDHAAFTVGLGILVLLTAGVLYSKLDSDFLPTMDEGGFVIDYIAPPGTSLTEIDRQLRQAEQMLKAVPEIESYSRRTGEALGVALVEPNTGDFLVKLKPHRARTTEQVIADVRERFNVAMPLTQWSFPGILSDLIGDLTWADEPIEIKLFSTDTEFLKAKAAQVAAELRNVPGVVDITNGVIYTGPSISIRVRPADAQRLGLTVEEVGNTVQAAVSGRIASTVIEQDRVVNIRVIANADATEHVDRLLDLPLRTPSGVVVPLRQVADLRRVPGQLELHRDDLRQDITVTTQLEGRDLGSAMADVRKKLDADPTLPPGSVEYGGLFEQQQESFTQLTVVLVLAVVLVFTVALLEFRSFPAPIAIVFGAMLAMFGVVAALKITGTSLNIVAFLGAIIGVGIVHKNGILLLDYVEHLRSQGMPLEQALVYSGRRRLRPVLMTSLAAAVGMLPLAYGIGTGTDMLRPMAIAVIGAVCISVILSLVATPTAYYLLLRIIPERRGE